MAIDNIYYLDQFSGNIYKTNSDQSSSVLIENVNSLGGSETLVNLQLSDTDMFLFGDAAIVLKRPISGGSWTTILDAAAQDGLLTLSGTQELKRLNGQNSKTRSNITTKDGNVYIAFLVRDTITFNLTTKLIQYHGSSWSVWADIENEAFFGWADLNYATNLVGLKTAIVLDQTSPATGDAQKYKNCNILRMISGSSMTILNAPTNVERYAITPEHTAIINRLGVGEGSGILTHNIIPSTGEIVATTDSQLIRISTDFSTVNHYTLIPDSGFPGFINSSVLLDDHTLLCFASSDPNKKFVVYDLNTNTISLNGTFAGLSGFGVEIFAVGLGDGTALIVPYNFGNYTLLFNPATWSGALAYTGDLPINKGYGNPMVLLPNGDVLRANHGFTGYLYPFSVFKYTKSTGTWAATSSLIPDNYLIQAMQVIPSGTYSGKVIIFYRGITPAGGFGYTYTSDCNYIIYDPVADSIVVSAHPVDISVMPSGWRVLETEWAISYPLMLNTRYKVTLDTNTVVDHPLISQPDLGTSISMQFIDSDTVRNIGINNFDRFFFKDFTVSFTIQEPVKSIANIQAVTAISTSEVYCVSASGSTGIVYTGESFLYKWDGSSWSVLYTFNNPSQSFDAITGWGEGSSTLTMNYTPLLMSSRYIGPDLQLVMLRDAISSVFTYTNGVLVTGAMQQVGETNTFGGAAAPSIPFLYNSDLSASVSLETDTGGSGFTDRNEVQLYAEARLIFKDSLSVYCLIRNSEVYFSTSFPVTSENTGFNLMTAPGLDMYLGPIPFLTDSAIAMNGQTFSNTYFNFFGGASYPTAFGKTISVHVPVRNTVSSSDGPMELLLDLAPGTAFTSTSAAHGIFTFQVPPTPSAKFLPTLGNNTFYLNLVGSTLYASGQNGVVKSTDGLTWTVEPVTCPIFLSSPTGGYFDQVNGVCENSITGRMAISSGGIQRENQFWVPISVLPPSPPELIPPLPSPFDMAVPLVFDSGGDSVLTGEITSSSPFYPFYAVFANIFSFTVDTATDVTISLTPIGGFEAYLTVSSLIGSPGSYSENVIIDNDPGTYTQTFSPGTYFVIPQGYYDTSFGSYTLDVSKAMPAPVTPPKIRRMTYDAFGDIYIGIFDHNNSDYQNVVGISPDAHADTWTFFPDQAGSSYFEYCNLRTDGSGVTLAYLGSNIFRVDTTNGSDPDHLAWSNIPGIFTSTSTSIATDGSNQWLLVSDGIIWYSSNRGVSWGNFAPGGSNSAKLVEFVNGKFVILMQNGSAWDTWSKGDVDFSTGVTKNFGVITSGSNLIDMRTLGNSLVALSWDRVWVSPDTGVSWGIPRILSFTSSANNITVGDSVNLSWTAVGATSASINNGVGSVSISGTTSVSPVVNTTYTLTETGDTVVTSTKSINVYAPPTISSFTKSFSSPGNTQLAWTVSGSSASINNGVGSVGLGSSSTGVNPASTTTYTLSVTNLASRVVTASLTLNPNRAWETIAYNGSIFMSVGISGDVITSSDGLVWTASSTIPSMSFGYRSFLRYVNGKWFMPICSGGSTVANSLHVSSDNGASWQIPTTLPGGSYTSVAFGAGVYVAVAWGSSFYGPKVIYSSDAVSWTEATAGLPSSCSFQDVVYANSKFVAVASSSGSGQTIFTSTDGITWSAANYPLGGVGDQGQWSSIAYGSGTFVVVSGSFSRYVATSSDGVNWVVTDLGATPTNQSQRVLWDGSQFVRMSKRLPSGTYAGYLLETSSNGTTWSTLYTASTAITAYQATDFAFGATKYVTLGSADLNLTVYP